MIAPSRMERRVRRGFGQWLVFLLALCFVATVVAACGGDGGGASGEGGAGGEGGGTDGGEGGSAGAAPTECPGGLALCDDQCVDTSANIDHCGECANVCEPGQFCVRGECASPCPTGFVTCDGACIDPESNVDFCGASGDCAGANAGQTCSRTEVCQEGACVDDDATLASLSVGSEGSLSPEFSPNTVVYVASIASFVNSVDVVAVPSAAGARLAIDGARVTPGVARAVELPASGLVSIDITVTAPSGSTKSYGVVVLMSDAAPTYVKASNAGAADVFGVTVALDGDTLAVGATRENSAATGVDGDQDDSSAPGSGAVYVFTRSRGAWTQQAYIKASNTGSLDNFGFGLALDGDTLAVGAYAEDSGATGIDGDQEDDTVREAGAVYVFTRSAGIWSQEAYIKASNTESQDFFGISVALQGDTLAVGAYTEASGATGVDGDQDDNSAADSGAVYLFTRDGGAWSQAAYLKASNTGAGDNFGIALALDGDTLAVAANREDSSATGIDGDQEDNLTEDSGAVYVFVREADVWSQQAYIKPSNTGWGDFFAESIALDGNTLAVGAIAEDSSATGVDGDESDNQALDSGAVYVFTRRIETWSQEAYLKASNTGAGDFFGLVALEGNTLLVGASGEASNASGIDGDPNDDSLPNAGAAYVFRRAAGGIWSQQAYLKASNPGRRDFFSAVALDGATFVIGSSNEDSSATGINGEQNDDSALDSGAVYVW